MARLHTISRVLMIGATGFALAGALPAPANAGFFEQLFGAQPQQQQAEPTYAPAPSQDFAPRFHQARPTHRVVKRADNDERPNIQKPTDIWHDKTLRAGDAVMTKSGMTVFAGRETSTHTKSDFVALDDARKVKPAERVALASLDGTRNDPLAKAANPDTVASGRSAAVGTPIVTGVKFTDQRGQTIRYIGP